jgi:YidC/Oxa1 family membrane protein insertase
LLFDPVYYAVSGVMWCWHQLFGSLFGPASGAAWALSVVFLVLTLRALLIRPFLAQVRSGRVMRELAPQLAELRTRHADDPARLLQETRALQREHGVGVGRMLLPMLLQVPVFFGLLHVLTGFHPDLANYAFGPEEVRSFLASRLVGVPLSAYLGMPLDAAGGLVDRWEIAVVTVPLILLAALATHLTARLSLRQQPADGPLAGVMRWMPWVFPLGVLVGGAFFPFPVAILLYWLTNSAWTLAQQWWVLGTTSPAPGAAPPAPRPPGGGSRRSAPPSTSRGTSRGTRAARRRRRPA